MKEFQMTYASIIGAVHEKLNYNNQDAVLVHRDKDLIIGLLANGCGSGKYTEVGARLITNYIKNYLLSHDELTKFCVLTESDYQLLEQAISPVSYTHLTLPTTPYV